MLVRYKNNGDRGFTLIELISIMTIIGIIAAIAAPNFIGFLRRQQVKGAFYTLVGAIKETQRQAMVKGEVCRININTSTNLVSSTPNGCSLSDRSIDEDILIRTNIRGATPNISFSHKGSTTKMGTIVVSAANTDLQKCFVIALGTGITRTGKYTGSSTGSVSPTSCIRE